MKNTIKFLGVIAIVAIVGFSIAACDLEEEELTGTVTIRGTAEADYQLSAIITDLDGDETPSYQWKRGDTVVGTDSRNYTVTDADIGSTITVTVSREGYKGSVTSEPTAKVVGTIRFTAVADSKFGTSAINGVAFSQGHATMNRFVAVGFDGKMAYSDNGTTWTAVTTSTFETSNINSIVWGGDKFIAVGNNGKMAYSANGTSWTAISSTDSTFGDNTINDIAYNATSFVAVGNNGKMATSSNGTTWVAVGDSKFGSTPNNILGVASGNGNFVAVGANGKMAYSNNGTSWTALTTAQTPFGATGSSTVQCIILASTRYVAGNQNGRIALSASNSETSWTSVSESTFGSDTIYGIAFGDGKCVAVGNMGKAAVSTDTTTWKGLYREDATRANSQFTNNITIRGIVFGSWGTGASAVKRFVLVGGNGKMAYWDGVMP